MHTAKIHSIETMGMVDGPGIRTVFFLQGCPLRCAYCHNPDTQSLEGGREMSVTSVLDLVARYRSYYQATGGGITFSGGEPLLQGAFLAEALKVLKHQGYHTCLDTSGFGDQTYFDEILSSVDLVLLDVKAFKDKAHKWMTGVDMKGQIPFVNALRTHQNKVIVRHVMVPGFTDSEEHMLDLLTIIKPFVQNVEKIEILPYHKNGIEKYSQINLPYRLEDVNAMPKDRAVYLEKIVNDALAEIQLTYKDRDGISQHSA